MFDAKENFSSVIRMYLAAYGRLTDNMIEFKREWETLGDDFFE